MRVLLYAPVAGRDPLSGDTTYTETLLSHPPPGVRYTTYAEALETGSLIERGRRRTARRSLLDLSVLGLRAVESLARGRVLFREATRFVTVDEDAFDLIHNHIFSLRLVQSSLPVVSSAGYPLSELYVHRDGWSRRRAARADRLEFLVARTLRSHKAGYWSPRRGLLAVYTPRYRDWLVERGAAQTRLTLVGQGLPDGSVAQPPTEPLLGFVGRDFRNKGGQLAVEAFRQVASRLPGARLLVVTGSGRAPAELVRDAGIEVVEDAPRHDVLEKYLPRISVLLAPTQSDCGVPFTIIEALRAGIPVLLSNNPWLETRLRPPGVQRAATPEQFADLAEQILRDADCAAAARAHAREQYENLLSLDSWHMSLRAAYRSALALRPGRVA